MGYDVFMKLNNIQILPSAWEGFPFSLVLFSRLYVVELRWFSPSPASLSPMYWLLNWCSDSQRNPLSQYVLHRPVIDYLQYQAGKFKNCKSTNHVQGKSGKSQFVCSHPSNLRAFLESRTRCLNICVSPFDVAALPSIADFSISSAPNFATKTKWNGGWQ